MLTFALRRLLWLLPTLLVLSVLAFGLQECSPGDPVSSLLPDELLQVNEQPKAYDALYTTVAKQLGRDLPPFYFTLSNLAQPDTLYRLLRKDQRAVQMQLLASFGNWEAVQAYYQELRQSAYSQEGSNSLAQELLLKSTAESIEASLQKLDAPHPIRQKWQALQSSKNKRYKALLPRLRWHGLQNRYHRWLLGVLQGDFGKSYLDKRSVGSKLWPALKWTALLNGLALLFAYLIALPLGLYTAYYAGSRFDRFSNWLLFLLFSLPSFWTATLLSNFLTTPVYGLDIFPTMGLGEWSTSASLWQNIKSRAWHFFLPLLCLTYPALAFLSRQMRSAARQELGKAYVLTAQLKGLNVHQLLWRHIFRNALFPIITLLGGLFPALLAGSVLIENIFNLPGTGWLLLEAILAKDWPVVTAILLLNGLLTALGLLLADMLYKIADPRLKPAVITIQQ